MITSEQRQYWIEKRFTTIINQILSWPDKKYSDKDLFISILKELNTNPKYMQDHIGSIILETGDINCMNDYYHSKQDIEENFNEYKSLLEELVGNIIENKYPNFIKYWNEIDKYKILMD